MQKFKEIHIADLQHQTQDPYAAEPALENNEVSDLGDEEDFIWFQ